MMDKLSQILELIADPDVPIASACIKLDSGWQSWEYERGRKDDHDLIYVTEAEVIIDQ